MATERSIQLLSEIESRLKSGRLLNFETLRDIFNGIIQDSRTQSKEDFERIMFLQEYRSAMLGNVPCSSFPEISTREEYLRHLDLQINSPASPNESILSVIKGDLKANELGQDIPLAECKRALLYEAHLSILRVGTMIKQQRRDRLALIGSMLRDLEQHCQLDPISSL